MEIEEIRLNNILLLDNSKLVKILWIKPNTCSVMDVNVDYPSAIVALDRLSGVELTRDILLDYGFKEGDNQLYFENDFIILEDSDGIWDLRIAHSSYFIKSIEFLHELQNILFELFYYKITSNEYRL